MKSFIYISLMGWLLFACTPKKSEFFTEKDGWVHFTKPTYHFDSYSTSITVDSIIFSLPNKASELPILISADSHNFYIYNKNQHEIIGFDKENHLESIRFRIPGERWIQSAFFKDSLCYAQSESAFILFNKHGQIIEETPLQESDILLYSNVNELPAIQHNNSHFIYAYNQKDAFRSPAYYDHNWVHLFSPNSKEITSLDLRYPDYFKKYMMGLSDVPYISRINTFILYGFSGDPNFYVYDLEKKNQKTYLGSSSYSEARFPIIARDSTNNINDLMKVSAHLDIYKTMVYDPINDVYLRSVSVANGNPSESKTYMQFFNHKFELIGEPELKEKTGKYLFTDGKIYYTRSYTDSTLILYAFTPTVQKKS